jgi:hypothetical protein
VTDHVDADFVLAQLLGVPLGLLHEELGGRWTLERQDRESPVVFVSGSPPQALVLVDVNENLLVVAEPMLSWAERQAAYSPGREHLRTSLRPCPPVAELAAAVDGAVRAKRKRLRWCRICRELRDPGYVIDGACMPCAERHLGIVF